MTPRAAPAALGPGRTPVDIEHLLSPADVIGGLRAPDKRAALQALTHHLAAKLWEGSHAGRHAAAEYPSS